MQQPQREITSVSKAARPGAVSLTVLAATALVLTAPGIVPAGLAENRETNATSTKSESTKASPEGRYRPAVPRQQKIVRDADGRTYVANQLLVSTTSSAKREEVTDILKDLRGTVVKEIKGPRMTFLVIEVPEGTLDKTEKKLSKDKHFSSVQRNYTASIRPQ